MTITTTWQNTPDWQPDPNTERIVVAQIVVDTARNGTRIAQLVDDDGHVIQGAALRSLTDQDVLLETVQRLLTDANQTLEARDARSRLIRRTAGGR